MANKRISELTQITSTELTSVDLLLVSDVSEVESKKLTLDDLSTYILDGNSTETNLTGSLYGTASWSRNSVSTSYAPYQTSASYAATSSWAYNSLTASYIELAHSAALSTSSSYALTASYALTSSAVNATSASHALFALSSSYLIYNPYQSNGTASNARTASYVNSASYAQTASNVNSASYARSSSNAQYAVESNISNYLNYTGEINGTAYYSISASVATSASNAQTASIALRSLLADTASVGLITSTNFQSSASWASRSLSASNATHSVSSSYAVTASYVFFPSAPTDPSLFKYGIFSAISHSATSSSLDVVSIVYPYSDVTASIDAVGTVIAYYTSSVKLEESISLNTQNRTTGRVTQLDIVPVYVDVSSPGSVFSGSTKIAYSLMGQLMTDEDDYKLYITCSSNRISLEPTRLTKFGVNINVGEFSISTGTPSYLQTTNSDTITFLDTSSISHATTAPTIVNSLGPVNVVKLDASAIFGHIKNVWTLTNLTHFSSSNNSYLTKIGGMPPSLTSLIVNDSSITALSPLDQTSLTTFSCSNNQLSELPALPNSITYFNCSNNPITTLGTGTPTSTTVYIADYLSITEPPDSFSNTIVSMSLSNNSLLDTWGTTLPNSLEWFHCHDNPLLTSLPSIPASTKYVDISNNSLLSIILDNICGDLVSSGEISGALDIRGNDSILSGTLTKIAALQTNGWTVLYT